MQIRFFKYQGAGNDFILLDNREGRYGQLDQARIERLCDRRFGIGADGLMLLNPDPELDFHMRYYNSDGLEGSMCGNGGRCISAFAHRLGCMGTRGRFMASDGVHEAVLSAPGWVELQMRDVNGICRDEDAYVLDTGSPHYVRFVQNLDQVEVYLEGKRIRHSPSYAEKGINVNFVERAEPGLRIRTYERGVENETFACGTGITAAAIVSVDERGPGSYHIPVAARGGNLEVHFQKLDRSRHIDIWLCGPATYVFEGTAELS